METIVDIEFFLLKCHKICNFLILLIAYEVWAAVVGVERY